MKRHPFLGMFSLTLVLVLVVGLAAAAQRSRSDKGWELLGRQQVDFKRDRDRIEVGRSEGRFNRLEIRVDGAPVEIDSMIVTFGNGEKFKPELRHRFDEGSKTRAIDLPGDRRAIKQIEFNYRSVNRREGKATVSVYGQ
jgi:hypothetical protein